MTRLSVSQSAAFWLIALILLAGFVTERLWPTVAFGISRNAYLEAAVRCQEASANLQIVASLANDQAPQTANALRQTAAIAMLDCYDRNLLREGLLANRVNVHALDGLEFQAQLAASPNPAHLAGSTN